MITFFSDKENNTNNNESYENLNTNNIINTFVNDNSYSHFLYFFFISENLLFENACFLFYVINENNKNLIDFIVKNNLIAKVTNLLDSKKHLINELEFLTWILFEISNKKLKNNIQEVRLF